MEKQILLWEKKLQLERETQLTLDPEYGQSELTGMKKEIHRMRLRLAALQKQQQLMTQEMVRSVHKHDAVKLSQMQLKAPGIGGGGATASVGGGSARGTGVPMTQASLTKKVQTLKVSTLFSLSLSLALSFPFWSLTPTHVMTQSQLKESQAELAQLNTDQSTVEADHNALTTELAKHQTTWSALEDKRIDVSRELEEETFRKDMVRFVSDNRALLCAVLLTSHVARLFHLIADCRASKISSCIKSEHERTKRCYSANTSPHQRTKLSKPSHSTYVIATSIVLVLGGGFSHANLFCCVLSNKSMPRSRKRCDGWRRTTPSTSIGFD